MRKLKRIGRTKPTPLLKKNLRRQLAALEEYFDLNNDKRAQRRPPIDHNVYRHPEVIEQILGNQEKKCAYCELTLDDMGSSNVTHYRPLSNAVLSEHGRSVIDYYAWYAYEWQNLLIVCNECNKAMSEMFPLDGPPVKPMSTWQEAELREKPLLINPYTANPSEHLMITYRGEMVGCTKKGAATIEVLKLNRTHLISEREECLEKFLKVLMDKASGNLINALSAYIDNDTKFPGAIMIFLQSLCRLEKHRSKAAEKLSDDALFKQVANILSNLSSNQTQSLFKRLDNRDLGFLINKTELDGFKSLQPARSGYITGISINNFKDISSLSLSITGNHDATPCMMLLGENATGKSSVLQAIKLALSPSKERTRLRKASANFTTKQRPAEIEITLDNNEKLLLSTNPKGLFESKKSSVNFLVFGYGARRYFSTHPRHNHKKYLNTTLFDPLAILRDPRDWLVEQDEHTFNAIVRAVRSILALSDDETIIRTKQRELLIKAYNKTIPVEQLSDGYKSLFIMSIDIMRELLSHWDNLETAEAVVLIDEVETHLHPRWKMRVMALLREAMPRVQFICSTHDPLCLRGMKNGEVHLLQRDSNYDIQAYSELPDITTLRIEQILSSDYFGLSSTEDPEQDRIIRRLAELAGISDKRLSTKERLERDNLLNSYEGMPYIGSSTDRQILAEALTRHLRLHPNVGIKDRGLAREQSIDEIMDVLKKAMA